MTKLSDLYCKVCGTYECVVAGSICSDCYLKQQEFLIGEGFPEDDWEDLTDGSGLLTLEERKEEEARANR